MHRPPRSSRTKLALVCAARVPAQGESSGSLADFALASDRAAVVERMLPGSEEASHFRSLQLQLEGRLDEADVVLAAWRRRLGQSDRVREIERRTPMPRRGRADALLTSAAAAHAPRPSSKRTRGRSRDTRRLRRRCRGSGARPTGQSPSRSLAQGDCRQLMTPRYDRTSVSSPSRRRRGSAHRLLRLRAPAGHGVSQPQELVLGELMFRHESGGDRVDHVNDELFVFLPR